MVMWVPIAVAPPLLHGVCALDWALSETHPPPRHPPQNCCPSSLPVFDTDTGRCLAQAGQLFGSVPMSEKQPAQRRGGRKSGFIPEAPRHEVA